MLSLKDHPFAVETFFEKFVGINIRSCQGRVKRSNSRMPAAGYI